MSANQVTHTSLYSGLSSVPALCLFFLQWRSSSVYNSHPKPSLWNILPAAAARCARAALSLPNPLPVFAQFAESPHTFFIWNHFSGHKRSCKLICNAMKILQLSCPKSLCVWRLSSIAARGGCKKRVLFSSQFFMLEAENSLYPPKLCRPLYLQGKELGSRQETGWGIQGGIWGCVSFWICSQVCHLHQSTPTSRGKQAYLLQMEGGGRTREKFRGSISWTVFKGQKVIQKLFWRHKKKPFELRSYQC